MNGIMCGGDTAGCGSAGEVDTNRSTIYFGDPEDDFEGFDAAGSTTLYLLDPPKKPDDWGDLDTGDFLFAPLSGGGGELDEFFETIGGPGGPKVLVSC